MLVIARAPVVRPGRPLIVFSQTLARPAAALTLVGDPLERADQRSTRLIVNGSIHCGRVFGENRLSWSMYARQAP